MLAWWSLRLFQSEAVPHADFLHGEGRRICAFVLRKKQILRVARNGNSWDPAQLDFFEAQAYPKACIAAASPI
jgi:hypothetical protein